MTTHHHRLSSGQPIHPACARQIASNILRRRHKAQHQQQRPQNLPSRPPSATGSSDPGLTWSNSVSPMLIRAQPIPELVILRPQIVTRAVDHKASAAEQPEPIPRDNSEGDRSRGLSRAANCYQGAHKHPIFAEQGIMQQLTTGAGEG